MNCDKLNEHRRAEIDPNLVRLHNINAFTTCAFFCCRYGNYEDLSNRIDDLVGMGIPISEMEEFVKSSDGEATTLLFSILHDTFFQDLVGTVLLDDPESELSYREIPVPIVCVNDEGKLHLPIYGCQNSYPYQYVNFMGKDRSFSRDKVTEAVDTTCREGQLQCLRVMETKGFDIQKYNTWGQMLVHRTCRPEIMQYFINQGTSIDVPCKPLEEEQRPRTALSNAILWKDEDSIECAHFLIQNGADLHLNEPSHFSMVEELFDYHFNFASRMHLDFARYLIENGLNLGSINALRLINFSAMCRVNPRDLEMQGFEEILKLIAEKDHDLFPDETILGAKMSLDIFKILWKQFSGSTNDADYQRKIRQVIEICQSKSETSRVDILLEQSKRGSEMRYDAVREVLAPLAQLPLEKIYRLSCLPTKDSCPIFSRVLKSIEEGDATDFSSWFRVLMRLHCIEIEKNTIGSHIFDLITADCARPKRVFLSMIGTIAEICPKSQELNVWWSCIPMAIENSHFRAFSQLVKVICVTEKQSVRSVTSDTAKRLRKSVHKYQTPLPTPSSKKQRKYHSKEWDPFFKVIKTLMTVS